MSASGCFFSKWLQKRSKCYNLNANYPFFLNLHRTWSAASVLLSTNQSKVKTLKERRGVDSRMSSRIAQGSQRWSALFLFSISLPLILFKDFFYCRSSCRRSGIGFWRNRVCRNILKVCSIFQHACFSLRNKRHIIVMIFIRTHWFLTRGLMPSWMFREIP